MFSLLGVFRFAQIATIVIAITAVWSYSQRLADVQAELSGTQRQLDLIKSRDESYKRMIARRDAAIDASTCKQKIRWWVSHPDDIPVPFDPFNQLKPQNERTP